VGGCFRWTDKGPKVPAVTKPKKKYQKIFNKCHNAAAEIKPSWRNQREDTDTCTDTDTDTGTDTDTDTGTGTDTDTDTDGKWREQ